MSEHPGADYSLVCKHVSRTAWSAVKGAAEPAAAETLWYRPAAPVTNCSFQERDGRGVNLVDMQMWSTGNQTSQTELDQTLRPSRDSNLCAAA